MQILNVRILTIGCLLWIPTAGSSFAQTTGIGLEDLRNAIGAANVDGTGVTFLQVEAEVENRDANGNGTGTFNYIPANTGVLNGKTYTDQTGTNVGTNSHATLVSFRIFGTHPDPNQASSGVAPGVGESGSPSIAIAGASQWLTNQLGSNFNNDPFTNQNPISQNFEVSNHSYIVVNGGTSLSNDDLENALNRFDWAVNDSDMVAVVGTANASVDANGDPIPAALPSLFVQAYNDIGVGSSTGFHASGSTTGFSNLLENGRLGVDIVAPPGGTSNTTGIVSGAAAVLHQTGDSITDADRSQVIKATLLAGADKIGDATDSNGNPIGLLAGVWDRTTTRPLDEVYGAGELNIFNSYNIQQGGEFNGSVSDPILEIGDQGWDYEENLGTGEELFYEFSVAAGEQLDDLSVILNWHADITDSDNNPNRFIPELSIADLELELYDSTGGFLSTLTDRSDSPVDNVEHIYFTDLQAGTYHLRVGNKSDSVDTDFALAFQATRSLLAVSVPEPSSLSILGIGSLAIILRRKRIS